MTTMTDDSDLSPEVRTLVEHSRRLLFNALDDLEGEKTLVWDRTLMKRVNLFTGVNALSSHGVTRHDSLDAFRPTETPHVVFLLSPSVAALDNLCNYIDRSKDDTRTLYNVFFVPEASYMVREKLKEREGGKYWERIESVKDIPLWWLPRDLDTLSLNEPQLGARQLINGDWTYMHRCAVALSQFLAMIPGKVPLYSKGEWAVNVAKMVMKNRSFDDEPPPAGGIRVNRVVIVDRWLDPLTPMLTQLTYSGLLDELYGVGMLGQVTVPQSEFEEKEDGDPFQTKEIFLNDKVFKSLRHVHVNALAHAFAGILQDIRKEGEIDKENTSIAEYKILVKKLPEIAKRKQQCNVHMRLAEMIKVQLYEDIIDRVKVEKDLLEKSDGDRMVPFIEEAILEASEVTPVLRLIAVHSLTSGGLKPSVLAHYRRLVMQSYGVDAVNRMLKMQKMGLLREKHGAGKLICEHSPFLYAQMKKQYELLVEEVLEGDRWNPAYAYSGYCSLLARIVAEGDKLKWVGWNKMGEHGGQDDDRTAVFVVGGATRAELALLRQMPNVCVVLSSALITGNSLLENLTRI